MTKGAETRDRIVDRAWRLASRDGLAGLSIGALATELGLSKSGLFAHFGSKEGLEVAVLEAAAARFVDVVLRPALDAPRGLPRVRKLFQHWLSWVNDPGMPGGCIFMTAAIELDDRPGPQRDALVQMQKDLLATLARLARTAIEERHFRKDLDCEQFAFEALGVMFGYHHARRLLHDPKAETRTRAAFERLIHDAKAS
jgi:AcrR family transcriptional regulator